MKRILLLRIETQAITVQTLSDKLEVSRETTPSVTADAVPPPSEREAFG